MRSGALEIADQDMRERCRYASVTIIESADDHQWNNRDRSVDRLIVLNDVRKRLIEEEIETVTVASIGREERGRSEKQKTGKVTNPSVSRAWI